MIMFKSMSLVLDDLISGRYSHVKNGFLQFESLLDKKFIIFQRCWLIIGKTIGGE